MLFIWKKFSEYYIRTHNLTGTCKLATEKFLLRKEKREKKKRSILMKFYSFWRNQSMAEVSSC